MIYETCNDYVECYLHSNNPVTYQKIIQLKSVAYNHNMLSDAQDRFFKRNNKTSYSNNQNDPLVYRKNYKNNTRRRISGSPACRIAPVGSFLSKDSSYSHETNLYYTLKKLRTYKINSDYPSDIINRERKPKFYDDDDLIFQMDL